MATTDPDTGFALDDVDEIVTRVEGDFEAQGFGYSAFARALLYPFPRALALVSYLLQGRLAWVVRQAFVTLAALINVRRWGTLLGLPYLDAVPERVTATFTGVAGTAIPITATCVRGDGVVYTQDAGGVVGGGGTVVLALTAETAGDFGASTAGTTELTLVTPIPDVASIATVASVTQAGADDESREDHAARIAERMASTPQGGAEADYSTWVRASQTNVDKVGVSHPSDNLVNVYFTKDVGTGVGGGILPSAGNVTSAQNYIDAEDADLHDIRRPVTAVVTVIAPTGTADAITYATGSGDADAIAAAEAALEDLLSRQAQPGKAYAVYLSQLDAAVQNAIGSSDYAVRALPVADLTAAVGQVVTGVITVT